MTSTATPSSPAPGISAVLATLAWIALAAVVALGGAGLVGELTHPPGGATREELTYPGDTALALRLDDASIRLRQIATNVDQLSADAKAALEDLASTDSTALQKSLDHGNGIAVILTTATKDLRNSLAGLPGDEPDAILHFSNAPLVRRASILAALLTASISGWSMVVLRRIIARRLERTRDQIEDGSRDALLSLHLSGMTLDVLRGAIVTALAMLIFSPIVRAIVAVWGSESDYSRAVVVIVAATVAGGALWKVFHSVRHVIWFFVGGLIVSAALLGLS